MQEILTSINSFRGIRGSMVMSKDGFLIVADVRDRTDVEAIAAYASAIIVEINRAWPKLNIGEFRMFSVTGDEGRIVFFNTGRAILVVFLDLTVKMTIFEDELRSAARDVERRIKF
ncbi:MAG: roadblock/LC7 domain-containing protein [Candidatus Brocadiia bacterium]